MHRLFLARFYAVFDHSYLVIFEKNFVILRRELCRILSRHDDASSPAKTKTAVRFSLFRSRIVMMLTLPISSNRRFQFHERGQLFIGTHNETLSIAAMRVGNEDRSPPESMARTQPKSNRPC